MLYDLLDAIMTLGKVIVNLSLSCPTGVLNYVTIFHYVTSVLSDWKKPLLTMVHQFTVYLPLITVKDLLNQGASHYQAKASSS